MRKIDDDIIRKFNSISEIFPNDFAVVEIVNIDHSIGEETGKILWLCDSFEEAWDAKSSCVAQRTIVLEGLNKMNVLGGFA